MDPLWVEFEKLTPDEWYERGLGHITREYLAEINEDAKEIIREYQDAEVDCDLSEHLHMTVDSSARVIYTYRAMKVYLVSDNSEYGIENDLVPTIQEESAIPWSSLAYWAMYQDLWVATERLGADLNFNPHEPFECQECNESWSDHVRNHEDALMCPSDDDDDEEEGDDDDGPD
jgi:hypothetical protein